MAAYRGSNVLLSVGGETVFTARDTSFDFGIETVDTSHKGTQGWRTKFTTFKSMTVSLEGVFENSVVEAALTDYAMNSTAFTGEVVNEAGESWSGQFVITAYGRGGNYADIETFTMTLENYSAITYTPVGGSPIGGSP